MSKSRLRGLDRPVASSVYFHPVAAESLYLEVAVTPGHDEGMGVVWRGEMLSLAVAAQLAGGHQSGHLSWSLRVQICHTCANQDGSRSDGRCQPAHFGVLFVFLVGFGAREEGRISNLELKRRGSPQQNCGMPGSSMSVRLMTTRGRRQWGSFQAIGESREGMPKSLGRSRYRDNCFMMLPILMGRGFPPRWEGAIYLGMPPSESHDMDLAADCNVDMASMEMENECHAAHAKPGEHARNSNSPRRPSCTDPGFRSLCARDRRCHG